MRMRVKPAALTIGVILAASWIWAAPYSLQGTANLALLHTLVAISLVVLTGWVGQISLAQAAFVGVGAFGTGVAVRSWGLSFPLTLPVAALLAGGAAALLAVVALRVRGLYLAVATLVFAWMTQEYLFNQPWFAGVGGSSSALTEPLGEEGAVPRFDFTERRTFYFIALAAVFGALLAAANLRDSKTGRAWFAVKGSEVAAASLGIDVTRYKMAAFAFSGAIAGIAGNLMMTHHQVVTISLFTVEQSLFYLSVAVVGGLTSIGGALAAGILFASLEELFYRVTALSGLLLVVSAGLLAFVLLFFPAGLAGIPGRLGLLFERAGNTGAAAGLQRGVRNLWRSIRAEPTEEPEPDEADPLTEVVVEAEVVDELVAEAEGGPVRLPRWLAFLKGPIARLGRRREPMDAPDVLAESLAAAEEKAEQERAATAVAADEEEEKPPLAYIPGMATKVKLPRRSNRESVLAASNVTVQFGGLTAVDSYDLEVRRNEIVGLMGPNGAGKTTLFNAISGLNEPTSGAVTLFGRDITKLEVHERARCGMGRTFQAIQLFGDLSVFENLMVATHHRNQTGLLAHLVASRRSVSDEAAARDRVRQVVALLGLEHVADRPAAGLPFGTLRLVELGRALVTGSPFVMLDEPASGLDNAETDRFMDLLLWARQSLGITMLLIEHDVRMVTGLSDYMYVIDRGKKIAEGTPAQVQRNEAVIAAYLGQAADAAPTELKPKTTKSSTKKVPAGAKR